MFQVDLHAAGGGNSVGWQPPTMVWWHVGGEVAGSSGSRLGLDLHALQQQKTLYTYYVCYVYYDRIQFVPGRAD